MSSSRLSDSPAKMGKTNAKPTLQNGGCRSRTTRSWFQVTMVTRAVHANSANLAGGGGVRHWRRKSFLTQALINLRSWHKIPRNISPTNTARWSTGSFSSRIKKTLPFHRTGLRCVKINNTRREILWFSHSVLEFLEKVESFIQKRYRQSFSGGKHTRF